MTYTVVTLSDNPVNDITGNLHRVPLDANYDYRDPIEYAAQLAGWSVIQVHGALGGHDSLALRFEGIPTTTEMNVAINSALAAVDPNVADWAALGNPGQPIRMNIAGDGIEGYDPRARYLFFGAL